MAKKKVKKEEEIEITNLDEVVEETVVEETPEEVVEEVTEEKTEEVVEEPAKVDVSKLSKSQLRQYLRTGKL